MGNWLLFAAAFPATLAPVAYARVPWRRTTLGRHLMVYMVSLAVVFDLGVIRLTVGRTWWFDVLRLIAFGFVVLALWWRLWIVAAASFGRIRMLNDRFSRSPR